MRTATLAMALAVLAGPAFGQERQVGVGELLGRGPAEAAERLGLIGQPPWLPYLGAVADGRQVAIVRADTRESTDCAGGVQLRSGDLDTYPELFVFVDQRLAAIVKPPPLSDRARITREDLDLARRRPAGPLPLAGGVQPYLDGLKARGFTRAESLRLSCWPPRPAPAPPPTPSAAQALITAPVALAALVWFSPYLALRPFETADRATAAREGQALVARLRLGEPWPEDARKSLVRWHVSQDAPGYAVAAIDLGGGRAGGVRDFVTVGVRGGRVEWIGPANSHMGLCQDAQGRPTTARQGCSVTGTYMP